MKKGKSMMDHMKSRNSAQNGPVDPPNNKKSPTYSDSMSAYNSYSNVMKLRSKAIKTQDSAAASGFKPDIFQRAENLNTQLGKAISENHKYAKSSGIKPTRTTTLQAGRNVFDNEKKRKSTNEPFTEYKAPKIDPSYARNTQTTITAYEFPKPKDRTKTITVKPMSEAEVTKRKKDYQKQTGKAYKPRSK
jgi:hypothetical protein